jgi:hypothetical protein
MNSSYERFNVPREFKLQASLNSRISELSFLLFGAAARMEFDFWEAPFDDPTVVQLANDVVNYISGIDPNIAPEVMSDAEIMEAKYWARSLRFFALHTCPQQPILMQPNFHGCGIVDPCEGDLLIGTTLWELKNVERDFRLADIKQLLTYSALNQASQQYVIESVGLVNARQGLCFKIRLSSLASMASAMSESELLGEIVRYITMDAPSR